LLLLAWRSGAGILEEQTIQNQQWVVAGPDVPGEEIGSGVLEWRESELPEVGPGQVRVRTLLLSLDPANGVWLSLKRTYTDPLRIGDVMRGVLIGEVDESRAEGFARGDLVTGVLGWQDYAVVDPAVLQELPDLPGVPLDAHLSLFSLIGLTAYVGVIDTLNVQPGESAVVSSAAGATGAIAGQIARIRGARTIGIAGGPEKCRYLVDELKFDEAIDYKAEDVDAALGRLCRGKIDAFFDLVGGTTLDAAMHNIGMGGRVLPGQVFGYRRQSSQPGPNRRR
jgi:hypothetical protein